MDSNKSPKQIFSEYKITPKKYLGQSFLADKNVAKKVVRAAHIEGKIVLEIGPGLGALTREIAQQAKKVLAVEKDGDILGILRELLKDFSNIEYIHQDILGWDLGYELRDKSYVVVANLPYAIVGPVLRKFLETPRQPETMTLMVQKEVAQRICARPPKMNLLAVSVQVYATTKILSYVSKNSFWPKPRVDSAILQITPRDKQPFDLAQDKPTAVSREQFFKIVKAGFKQPRKQLINNFTAELNLSRVEVEQWLQKANISPTQRPETLSTEDWLELVKRG